MEPVSRVFHMTSRWPFWCPKTMKRRPCCCTKPILCEFNSFLMQTLSFVPINFIDAGHVSENALYDHRWSMKVYSYYPGGSFNDVFRKEISEGILQSRQVKRVTIDSINKRIILKTNPLSLPQQIYLSTYITSATFLLQRLSIRSD